jgi:hypothetical protein
MKVGHIKASIEVGIKSLGEASPLQICISFKDGEGNRKVDGTILYFILVRN